MYPPEDDTPPEIYQEVAQKMHASNNARDLPSSCTKNTHKAAHLFLVVVVSSFIVWLEGIESA
jgi:hypothetical protein